jgi:hypothetical protein
MVFAFLANQGIMYRVLTKAVDVLKIHRLWQEVNANRSLDEMPPHEDRGVRSKYKKLHGNIQWISISVIFVLPMSCRLYSPQNGLNEMKFGVRKVVKFVKLHSSNQQKNKPAPQQRARALSNLVNIFSELTHWATTHATTMFGHPTPTGSSTFVQHLKL